MGRVRTKTVKKASKIIIEKYYPRLTLDFDTNKKICAEVAVIPSKRLRNKIAGFVTHLMRRIQKGPVRGISFKLQEEERERKDNYVPDVSAIETDLIEIDADTKEMLKSIGFDDIPGVSVVALENLQPQARERFEDRRERGERGERTERGERGAGERGERSGEKRTGGAGGEGRQRTEGQQRAGGEKRTGGAGGEGRSERGGARGGRGGRGGARGGARTGGAGGERRGPRGDGGKRQGGDESRA